MQFSEKNDLNWTVRSEGLVTVSGLHVPDKIAIVREDTAAVLSIMGKDYNAFQNHEMIEILERVSNQTGLELKRSGLFGDGEKVFVQLKSDDLKLGNDRIEGYLTGVNSFDGSTSFAFGPSNVTISCTNSFFSAFRGLNTKVRHTKNMGIKIDEICRSLEGMLDEEKKIFDSIVQLSETRVGEGDIENVIRKLFNVKPELDLDAEEMSTVTKNKIDRFYIDLNGELKEKGNNQWGLFSGITKYTTHSMGKDSTKNMENKMFGLYGTREKEIFNELVGAL